MPAAAFWLSSCLPPALEVQQITVHEFVLLLSVEKLDIVVVVA